MSFNVGHTTFGFTMRVPDAEATAVDELIASHAAWMRDTHSVIEEEGKLHTLEYYVSKASELNDMMDPSKGTTGQVIYTVSEVHKDDEHFGKHVELGQSWDRINEFFGLFEKYNPLVTMAGRVTAKLQCKKFRLYLSTTNNLVGGWSTQSIGQGYGKGYGLEIKVRWMQKIVQFACIWCCLN